MPRMAHACSVGLSRRCAHAPNTADDTRDKMRGLGADASAYTQAPAGKTGSPASHDCAASAPGYVTRLPLVESVGIDAESSQPLLA